MSNNQVVIDTLIKKRDQLIVQRDEAWSKFKEQIDEIEDALDTLAGKQVWRTQFNLVAYDDENPDYIKNTEDGI